MIDGDGGGKAQDLCRIEGSEQKRVRGRASEGRGRADEGRCLYEQRKLREGGLAGAELGRVEARFEEADGTGGVSRGASGSE